MLGLRWRWCESVRAKPLKRSHARVGAQPCRGGGPRGQVQPRQGGHAGAGAGVKPPKKSHAGKGQEGHFEAGTHWDRNTRAEGGAHHEGCSHTGKREPRRDKESRQQ